MTTDKLYSLHGSFSTKDNMHGIYPLNNTMTIKHFSHDNLVQQKQQVNVNNFGWISKNNYSLHKASKEYRISILGDSLTACITSNLAWPDITQDYLNNDLVLKKILNVDKISVLNLGINGIGLQFMADPVGLIAKRFDSDMVVVNFPLEDLYRRHSSNQSEKLAPAMHAYEKIDGIGISLDCTSSPFDISNPNCKMYVIWYTPANLALSKNLLNSVKQKFGAKMARNRIMFSKQSILARRLLNQELTNNKGKCSTDGLPFNPLPTTMVCDNDADNIEVGINSIKYIQALNKWDVLVTHNPLLWHLSSDKKPAILDKFIGQAKLHDIEVTQMDDYLPIQEGPTEFNKWYNMPHDGHWSDYGAEVYGKAMYLKIRDYLLKKTKI